MGDALRNGIKDTAGTVLCVAGPTEDLSDATASTVASASCGAMKSYSSKLFGDHDGMGSLQAALSTIKRRGANWRDQEEVAAEYELTENAEMLLEFLGPRDQQSFPKHFKCS